ncbi:MAG: ATP-binding protein [Anaerolineales bacterium]|nr:ATP-binding protein [Anaerolineales bacterium]
MADLTPFPFLALVGQMEMKLALALALINPVIGGVLLIGPRGTGKTTAVRSLIDLLPQIPRSLCYYGCMPEDVEGGGIDAICPDCARKFGQGEPLATLDKVRLVELPLNARLEDVIGGLDERAALHERLRLKRGLLSQADKNLLYVDEVNLLADEIVDAILDAAAQGSYTVRRGPISSTYRSRFVLIGSMNPEEGRLRPQILDRFGLRVVARGLSDRDERLEAYKRVQAYLSNPRSTVKQYSAETNQMAQEIQSARDLLPQVDLPNEVAQMGLELIEQLKIDSLRAEITLFEAGRAHAAADGREKVTYEDLRQVAPMALRLRSSAFMVEYLNQQAVEDEKIYAILDNKLRAQSTPGEFVDDSAKSL